MSGLKAIIDKKWAGSGRCKNHIPIYYKIPQICNIINFLSHVLSPPVSDPVDSDRLNDQFTWALHPSPDVATDGLDPWKFAFRRNY